MHFSVVGNVQFAEIVAKCIFLMNPDISEG